jgi:cytochrome c-type biogenesis protein
MPEIGGVGLLTALFAGAISFFSPCVLPLVPGYLSAVTGIAPSELQQANWRTVIPPALLFIASFSVIFILLGLSAVGISQSLRSHQDTLEKIAGAMIIALGVLFVASLFINRLNREWHADALIERAGSGGPVLVGAAFAVAWTPCVGPTLGAISTLAATSGSVLQGAIMLAVYCAGLGIPFLLTAIAFSRMTTAFTFVKQHYAVIMATGGVVLIAMGILVFTGEFTRLNIELQRDMQDIGINFFNEV